MIEYGNTQAAVADYIRKLAGRPVATDEAIISSQLLESIAAVQLIAFVQNRFGVVIEDDDLVVANFDSVDAIVTLVHRKIGVR